MITQNDLSIKGNKFDRCFKIHNRNKQQLDARSSFPFASSVNRSAKHEYRNRNTIVIRFKFRFHKTKIDI